MFVANRQHCKIQLFFFLPVLFKVKVLQLQAWNEWAVWVSVGLLFSVQFAAALTTGAPLFPQQAFSSWVFTLVPDQQINAAEKPVQSLKICLCWREDEAGLPWHVFYPWTVGMATSKLDYLVLRVPVSFVDQSNSANSVKYFPSVVPKWNLA